MIEVYEEELELKPLPKFEEEEKTRKQWKQYIFGFWFIPVFIKLYYIYDGNPSEDVRPGKKLDLRETHEKKLMAWLILLIYLI